MASIINAITTGVGGLVQTGDASGVLALQAANTTIASVSSTGVAVTGTLSATGDLAFNSGFGSAATAYGCRAWVNFNGTGTVAIRASGNVSSITDNGVGDYTINFTTAMSDSNYAAALGARATNSDMNSTFSIYYRGLAYSSVQTASSLRVNTGTASTGASGDCDGVEVAIFR